MVLTNVKNAIDWLVNNFGGMNEGQYKDETNENFLGKVVGYRYRTDGKIWKRFLVTFRPRGVTSFLKAGKGAMTMMNMSEILAQIKERRNRLVIFQEQSTVRAYVFKTTDIVKSIMDEEADPVRGFANYPCESEKGFNIPIKLGINLREFLENGEE
jgi:hypothetical protein